MTGSTDGTGAVARFSAPYGVTVDSTGTVYVADTGNSTLRKVTAAGVVTTLAGGVGMATFLDGTGTAARFNNPNGMTIDSSGNLYVIENNNTAIRKVVTATGVVTTLAGAANQRGIADSTFSAARFAQPQGVVTDGAGNLYVADTSNSTIRKIVVATGAVTTLAGAATLPGSTDAIGTAAQFRQPRALALDGLGNLYVADTFNHTIRKVVIASRNVTTLAGTAVMTGTTDGTGAAARFNQPSGIVFDNAGNLFIADAGNYSIRKLVAATGVVTTVAGTAGTSGSTDGTGTAAQFFAPQGLSYDGAGNLYIADTGNSTIRKLVIGSGVVSTIAGTAGMLGSTDGMGSAARFRNPRGVAVDGAGNLLVADPNGNTIRQIALGNANVTTLIGVAGQRGVQLGPLPASLNQPCGITVSPTGSLYLTDQSENAILTVR